MRELVYLSDRKLAGFLPDRPPWWRRLGRRATLEIATPVGTVGLGGPATPTADDARADHFAAVVAEVERSARWFAEPGLTAGRWVQFEAPMAWTTATFSFALDPLAGGDEQDTGRVRRTTDAIVLFVDVEHDRPRLVLHGSPQHLLEPAGTGDVPFGRSPMGSAASSLRRFVWGATRNALDAPSERLPVVGSDLRRAVAHLRGTGPLQASAGEWVAGYARLTDRYDDIVCATPLYVERVSPPPD